MRPAAEQRQHAQRILITRVDTPLAMRGEEPELEVRFLQDIRSNIAERFHVLRRTVTAESLAEVLEPLMVLIEVSAPAQRAERNVLMDVGVARGIGHMLGLNTRPGWRG